MPAVTEAPVITRTRGINLNTATMEELVSLPGIGEKTAAAILALREQIGCFHYPEDLLLVNGIGNAKLKAIFPLVYVGFSTEGDAQWN